MDSDFPPIPEDAGEYWEEQYVPLILIFFFFF